jgi:hypothetical protein
VIDLHRALGRARASADRLATRIYDDEQFASTGRSQLPSEEVSDFIQRHGNYFPDLEGLAERVWQDARLVTEDIGRGLVRHLADRFGVRVDVRRPVGPNAPLRHFDPVRRVLALSSALPPHGRSFQIAVQIGLLSAAERLEVHLADAELTSDASRRLCRVVLANYFAGAVLMPYDAMLEAARVVRSTSASWRMRNSRASSSSTAPMSRRRTASSCSGCGRTRSTAPACTGNGCWPS